MTRNGCGERESSVHRPAPERSARTAHAPAGATAAFSDTLGEWVLGTLLERAGAGDAAKEAASAWQDDRVVFYSPKGAAAGRGIGFTWRIRAASPAGAKRIAELLAPLYAGRPAPARPSVTTRGDVVEVVRAASPATAG